MFVRTVSMRRYIVSGRLSILLTPVRCVRILLLVLITRCLIRLLWVVMLLALILALILIRRILGLGFGRCRRGTRIWLLRLLMKLLLLLRRGGRRSWGVVRVDMRLILVMVLRLIF